MNCKDCIHEDVCKIRYFPSIFGLTGDGCPDFKNKADVVEVVRCGQCKYWKINPHNMFGGQCRYSECAAIDHYCSYGKRKCDNG